MRAGSIGIGPWSRGAALARLHPTVRLACLASTLGALLVLDPFDPRQAAGMAAIAIAWSLFAGLGARRFARLAALGVALFAPFLALAPWAGGGRVVAELGWLPPLTVGGLAATTRIAARGVACLLVGAGAAASLGSNDLPRGLALPVVPRLVTVMVVQIFRWMEVLLDETRGMSRAIALRRPARAGASATLRLARSLPLAWLPRVVWRAERVAAAMEVRGYRGELPLRTVPRPRAWDVVALAGAALVLAAAVLAKRVIA